MRKVTSSLIALLTLAAAVFLACGEEDVIIPRPTAPAATTPARCLTALAASWSAQDYNAFLPCVAADFTFYFNPNDVGSYVGGYIIPVSWTYAEMTRAVDNMLAQAYSIDMNINTASVGTPGPNATVWEADGIPIEFTLMVDEQSGYRIGAGYAAYAFKRYSEEGEYRWRLTGWWDYTRESRDSEAASLGRVLALYYGGE